MICNIDAQPFPDSNLIQSASIELANAAIISAAAWSNFSVRNVSLYSAPHGVFVNISNVPVEEKDEELEIIFNGLAKIWRDSTGGLSSTARRFAHPTYKAILRLGPEIVPLILQELQKRPDWWFDALEFLTKTNAARPEDSFAEAASAWIKWGKRKRLIS